LTLALHELATNAAKYGALSNAAGRVHVRWKTADTGQFRFSWQERGGPTVAQPERKGFGSTLIERTFQRVRLRFSPRGLTCAFDTL
jgi:two-component sensor histidine kinase